MVIAECPHCKATQLVPLMKEEKGVLGWNSCPGCGQSFLLEKTILARKAFADAQQAPVGMRIASH